jgi:hypothetical protein
MVDQYFGRVNWLGQNCVILVAFVTAPGCPTDLRIGTSALFGPNTAEPGAHVGPLSPRRALALAVALTQLAVATIKVNQFGPGWPG